MNLDKLSNMVRKTFKPTEVEAKLQEALSKKNWGASSTVMNDISRYTFDYQEYSVVMKAVWKHQFGWPFIRKFCGLPLNVLEYLSFC